MTNKETTPQGKSIVFIGFMGVGKTSIGKVAAEKLNREFIDIDEEIEKEYQMTTSDIFKKIGEKAFREVEMNMIAHYSNMKSKIISVGGGAFLQAETRKICLSKCTVYFLDLSWEAWQDRISLIIDSRPVLQGKSMEEMKELFYDRQSIYKDHHIKINTDNLSIDKVADAITDSLAKG